MKSAISAAANKINTAQSASKIVADIFSSKDSVLVIPPRFEEAEIEYVLPPESKNKYIGLFSSGSTGAPKCIWNSFENLSVNAEISKKSFNISSNDRVLILASPWHVAGLSWALMAENAGSRYKIVTPFVKKSENWIEIIREFKLDILFTVPSVLRYLSEFENWFVERIAFGGASLQPNEYFRLNNHCKTVIQAYGQTEAGGLISIFQKKLSEISPEKDFNCVGTPPQELHLETSGTEHSPSPVYLKSPSAFTSSKYKTGDLGYFDEFGQLHLSGRENDSGGDCNMITSVTSVVHK